jgi:elongation of very long chain fatty acids protein 6
MSALLPLPLLQYLEYHADAKRIVAFNKRTWTVSLYATAIYLALVFQGRRWMYSRKPYNLKKQLILWNVGLAVFSILGTASVLPSILRSLFTYGVDYTVCFSDVLVIPRAAIWCYLFGLSKLLELGDTAFIVLRKSPLPFLHWYHHVTVLVYTHYGMNDPNAVGSIFSGMNFFVHSLMYSYYAARAMGFHIPRWIAQFITLLQLSQMFVGVYITVLAFYNSRSGRVPGCIVRDDHFFMATAMYFTYAVLFLNFFYQKYCAAKDKSKLL